MEEFEKRFEVGVGEEGRVALDVQDGRVHFWCGREMRWWHNGDDFWGSEHVDLEGEDAVVRFVCF